MDERPRALTGARGTAFAFTAPASEAIAARYKRAMPTGFTPPAPPSAPGDLLFNRYRYLREIGRGGMGRVLLARDEVLGIEVALKLVPEEVVRDADGLGDLKREVLRGMRLSHP